MKDRTIYYTLEGENKKQSLGGGFSRKEIEEYMTVIESSGGVILKVVGYRETVCPTCGGILEKEYIDKSFSAMEVR